jgi:hypothetical protein
MNAKIDAPKPQRISVPQGTVLQIYSRDEQGNRMLVSLPGPADISMVQIRTRTQFNSRRRRSRAASCYEYR